MMTPRIGLQAALVLGAWMSWAGACSAQQPSTIQVLLLNGSNGAPLGNTTLIFDPQCRQGTLPECVHVYDGQWPWRKTNATGVVDLPISDILVSFTISRHAGDFKYCQDVGKNPDSAPNLPRFNVADILRTGVVAPDTCSIRLHIQPRPGQLVFFLRPFTVFEELTKPPQM